MDSPLGKCDGGEPNEPDEPDDQQRWGHLSWGIRLLHTGGPVWRRASYSEGTLEGSGMSRLLELSRLSGCHPMMIMMHRGLPLRGPLVPGGL